MNRELLVVTVYTIGAPGAVMRIDTKHHTCTAPTDLSRLDSDEARVTIELPNVVRITRHNDVLPVPGDDYDGSVDYVICSGKTTFLRRSSSLKEPQNGQLPHCMQYTTPRAVLPLPVTPGSAIEH